MTSAKVLERVLDILPYGYVPEYQFDKHYGKRLFRADFCIPKYGILIEFEGLSKRNSRHQSLTGYTKDSEKYNLATVLGFNILRYTQLSLNDTNQLILDIKNLIKRIELNSDPKAFCYNCDEQLFVSRNLWIENNNGFLCLTCQWIQDDLIKNKPKKTRKKN